MVSSNSQIDKPQRGRTKRAELPDVNVNKGTQSINIEMFEWKSLQNYDVTLRFVDFSVVFCVGRIRENSEELAICIGRAE